MKIKTKFGINEIIQHKFSTDDEGSKGAYEVLQVMTESCYAGTQVFYLCRSVIILRETEGFGDNKVISYTVAHGITKNNGQMAWQKFREDEMVIANDAFMAILNDVTK